MSTETAALTQAPVADVPEAALAGLAPVEKDYGVDKFWNDEPAKPAEPAVAEPAAEKGNAPATETEVKGLASKWAAKVKVKAEVTTETPSKKVEPAAVAEVKADEPPENKLELDSRASPAARENFKNLKTIAKTLREQLAAQQRENEQLKSTPAAAAPAAVDTAEMERLKAEHKAMSDKLLIIDTKNHPVFQNQYVKPRQEALAAAAELLKAHGKEADLAALIERPRGEIGKELQELLKDVPAFDQTEISAGIQQAYKLSQQEKAALASASQVNGAIKQNDSQTHVKAFDTTWGKVSGSMSEMLEPAEIPANAPPEVRKGIENYNQAMASLQEDARRIATGTQSYESIAEASIKAAAYDRHIQHVMPRIGAEFNAMQDVIRGLKAEVEGYRSRNPNRDIRATTTAPAANNAAKDYDSLAAETWK